MKIISQSSSPGVREKINMARRGTISNDHLLNLIATKSKKTKEEVMKEMTNNIERMSDSSDDEIDMNMFEDEPKTVTKEGEEGSAPVSAPVPYKALKDNHDYGLSDNEE